MRNVALDLGSRKVHFCEVRDGEVVLRDVVPCFDALLRTHLGPQMPRAKVALEACRDAWHVHDALKAHGHEPVLVDTTRVKRIGVGQHRRKTDRIDAEALARALERDAIPRAHVLSPTMRELRSHLMVRRTLVATRAEFVTCVRGHLRAAGYPLRACAVERFGEKLDALALPEATAELIKPLRLALAQLDGQIHAAEMHLQQQCDRHEALTLLMTVPGVGPIVSAAFIAVIDDPNRFSNAHQVGSYLGLVPSEDTSGGLQRLGHISKQGNDYARAVMVEGANALLNGRSRDPLRIWGLEVARRRGRRIANVAVARRLASVMYAVWKSGRAYDPRRLAAASAAGVMDDAVERVRTATALKDAARKARRRTQQRMPTGATSAAPATREVSTN